MCDASHLILSRVKRNTPCHNLLHTRLNTCGALHRMLVSNECVTLLRMHFFGKRHALRNMCAFGARNTLSCVRALSIRSPLAIMRSGGNRNAYGPGVIAFDMSWM